ncbi:MAG: molybdate ABC transporter substrate-binding protein [Acidobacteria bacterium]|nr:molybdate ABC transporter substrate-binding protein [Acidobacteriota bacterium]
MVVAGLFAFSCRSAKNSTKGPPAELVVAAAADLRYAMEELSGMFQAEHSGAVVRVNYGSSGILATQIENGAPFDIFFSADLTYPRRIVAKDMAVPNSEFLYAVGRIVVWVPSDSLIDVGELGMDALREQSIRHIAIANPAHAPYGKAAVSAMRSLGVYEAVEQKLAYGENVSQTLQYIQTGTAEIGIVALSLAMAPSVRETGRYWEIPIETYPTMEQGGVILKSTRSPELANEFRSFLLSEPAREVLRRYGFYLPAN